MTLENIRRALSTHPHRVCRPGETSFSAAVALILLEVENSPDLEILLIRRAERVGDPWSGQMAFPGGRFDPQDADQYATVIRETWEEVGLDLRRNGQLIGRLDDIAATVLLKRTSLNISPFVFALEKRPLLSPNHEVAEAIWAPLGPMVRGEVDTETIYRIGSDTVVLPAYSVQGRILWGLSYSILQNLFSKICGSSAEATSSTR
jgi:8-oxo-dGTP pyrophosphatase MutT (NUDIX family)